MTSSFSWCHAVFTNIKYTDIGAIYAIAEQPSLDEFEWEKIVLEMFLSYLYRYFPLGEKVWLFGHGTLET